MASGATASLLHPLSVSVGRHTSARYRTQVHKCSDLPRRQRLAALVIQPSQRHASCPVARAQKQQFGSFDQLVQESELPVLVDFHAPWCGPCSILGRVIDIVAPIMKDKVRFVKVDTEKYEEVAGRYAIHALPTMILFKGGQPVDRAEGLMSEVDLRLWLQRRL